MCGVWGVVVGSGCQRVVGGGGWRGESETGSDLSYQSDLSDLSAKVGVCPGMSLPTITSLDH